MLELDLRWYRCKWLQVESALPAVVRNKYVELCQISPHDVVRMRSEARVLANQRTHNHNPSRPDTFPIV